MSVEIKKSQAMDVFERFRQTFDNRHDYAREWKKRTGGRVVGYLCTYVPEEILYAANILPVRIFGGHEPQDITEPHIWNMFCAYSRDCLAQGLLGRYSYLDGIVAANGCQHIRQTHDSWQRHIPISFSYFFYMTTHVQSRAAHACLPDEVRDFRTAVEEWTGKAISDDALNRAIEVFNTNRRLMKDLYELRKSDPPMLSGLEALEMVAASMVMEKEDHNRLLEQAKAELKKRSQREAGKVRVMMVGSEMDDLNLMHILEAAGASVVVDDSCVGTRYFWNQAEMNSDPILSISERYLNKPPCPVYDITGVRRRKEHILTLAHEYNVQTCVLILQKFCEPHEMSIPAVQSWLKERDISTLVLETDITISAGQVGTRIEAHLEMLDQGE